MISQTILRVLTFGIYEGHAHKTKVTNAFEKHSKKLAKRTSIHSKHQFKVSLQKPTKQDEQIRNLYKKLKKHVSRDLRSRFSLVSDVMTNSELSKLSTSDLHKTILFWVKLARKKPSLFKKDYAQTLVQSFFNRAGQLSADSWDRNFFLEGEKTLQRALSPELDALLKMQSKKSKLKKDKQHQLKISYAKAQLAVSLGHGITRAAGGANGAMLIKSLENEYIGVFKAPHDTPLYQVGEHMKSYFGQRRLMNQKDKMAEQFAEIAGYKFDNIFGFGLAPAATMGEIGNEKGAFIGFFKGYKELKSVEKPLNKRSSFTKNEKLMWQRMCLYNFLIGNLDPHNENIFVQTDSKGRLTDLRMIDHGNCFIKANPGKYGSKGNQGAWGDYKISKSGFSKDVKKFIAKDLTKEKLETFFNACDQERPGYLTPKMKKLMGQRLDVLRHDVLKGKVKSPKDLAKIHTSDDFKKLVEERELTSTERTVVETDHVDLSMSFMVVDFK